MGLFVSLWTTCKNTEVYKALPVETGNFQDLTYEVSSLNIPVKDSMLFQYLDNMNVFEEWIYLLDVSKQNIYLFNTVTGQVVQKNLTSLLPNKTDCGIIENTYFHTLDSLFLISENCCLLVDNELNTLKQIDLEKDIATQTGAYLGQYYRFFKPYFDNCDNTLYLQYYFTGITANKKNAFKKPVEAGIDIQNNLLKQIPVSYPIIYHSGQFGHLLNISRTVSQTKHIFSFDMNPNLYVWDKQNSQLKAVGGKSNFQNRNNIIEPKKKQKVKALDLMITSPAYPHIVYDKYRQLYYRIFLKEQELKNTEGKFSVLSDKKMYLMVFDEQFNLLKEIHLSRNKYFYHLLVLPEGLAVSKMQRKNADYDKQALLFDVFAFHYNKKND